MKTGVRQTLMLVAILMAGASDAAVKYFSDAGGPLTWDTGTTMNWGTTSGGPYTTAVWVTYDNAVFEGTGGFLNLNSPIANTVTFNVDGYVLTNSVLSFGNPQTYNLTAAAGVTAAIRSMVTVSNAYATGLRKYGPGTVVLSGSGNSAVYLLVDQGTLGMADGSFAVGATGFKMGVAGVSTNTPTFHQSGGTVTVSATSYLGDQTANGLSTFTISGGSFGSPSQLFVVGTRASAVVNVSGNGILTASTLQLGHTASTAARTNTVNLLGGTLAVSGVPRPQGTGYFHFNGGTLLANASNGSFMTGLSAATVRAGGAVIDAAGFNITIGQALLSGGAGDDGGLTKLGSGVLTLSGANTYTGATLITAGTLQIGAGTASGSAGNNSPVSVPAGSGLTFYRSDNAYAIGNRIEGGGTLTLAGTGASAQSAYQFSQNNTGFTGVVYISNARLQGTLGNIGNPSMIHVVDTTNNSGQVYGGMTVPVTIAGLGWQEGAGRLGALRLENQTWSGPITLAANARIGSYANGSSLVSGTITGPYELEFWCGNGTQTFTVSPANANAYAATRVSANAVVVAGNSNAISSGPLTMNGGTLRLNGSSVSFSRFASTAAAGVLQNASPGSAVVLTVGADGASTAYGGSIADGGAASLALTKVGAGTLTLDGAGTYSGATVISNGALLVNGSLGTNTTSISAGATLAGTGVVAGAVASSGITSPGAAGPGILTVASYGQDSTGVLHVELGGPTAGAGYDRLSVGGQASLAGSLTVTNIGGFLPLGVPCAILRATNVIGTFATTNLPAISGAAWDVQYSTTDVVVSLVSTAVANSLVWMPAASADWDDVATNWTNSVTASLAPFAQGDDVLFDDSGAYSNNVKLAIVLAPRGVTVNASSNYLFSGAGNLSGAMRLTKDGTGTLVVTTTNNSFTGGAVISNGTLQLGDGGACGTLGIGPVTDEGSLVFNNGDTAVPAGAISGGGGLTKTGTGMVVLAAANSFSGGTTIDDGTLRFDSVGAFPGAATVNPGGTAWLNVPNGTWTNTIAGAGRVRVANVSAGANNTSMNGDYSGFTGTIEALGNAGGGKVTLRAGYVAAVPSSSATMQVNDGTTLFVTTNLDCSIRLMGAGNNENLGALRVEGATLSGPVTLHGHSSIGAYGGVGTVLQGIGQSGGSYALTKLGGATIVLAGTNTYGGATTVSAGRLELPHGAAITNGSALNIQGGSGATLVIDGGTFLTGLNSGNAIHVGASAGNTGTLQLTSGSVAQTGTSAIVTFGDYGSGVWNQSGGAATFAGQVWLANNPGGFGQINVSNGTFTVQNSVQFGVRNVASLTVDGPSADASVGGDFLMGYGAAAGGSAYTYVTLLDGSLHIGGNLIHGNSYVGSSTTSVWTQAGGTVTVDGAVTVGNWGSGLQEMTISGGRFLATNALARLAIRGSASYPTTLTITNTGFMGLNGLIFGHPGGNATGVRTLNLAGAGVLEIGSGGLNWNNGVFTVNLDGGTLRAAHHFAWTASTNSTAVIRANGAVIDTTNFNVTISQDLTDGGTGGGLVKLGGGTLVLHGSSTYTGPTAISNGTILVQGVIGPGGAVTVDPDAALGGTGVVVGAVSSHGSVAPGASVGKLLVVAYDQHASGSLDIDVATNGVTPGVDFDQLYVVGAATLDGFLTVSLANTNYSPAPGDAFAIISAGTVSGTFATTTLPVLPEGLAWTVTYSSSNVILSVTNSASPSTGYDLYAGQIPDAADRGYQNDPDGDGYANLLEYVTGGNPTNADVVAQMKSARTNGVLALKFSRSLAATDATLYVEGSYATTNDATWTGIATNLAGSWGGAPNVSETGGPDPLDVTVADTDPAATNRFLRLRVTRP